MPAFITSWIGICFTSVVQPEDRAAWVLTHIKHDGEAPT